ncbi:MAG: DUF1599 domain-containing protein [Sphingobacteriales bacterium]|nr:MAG: DUF1599 domain-containing protein [Sphingobacteriales bacterium]
MQSELTNQKRATLNQYHDVRARCKTLFLQKTADYGTSWRVLRPVSVADQIYIKAWRIRQLQSGARQLVEDSIESEFIGIVNYGIIGLVQLTLPQDESLELTPEEAGACYQQQADLVEALMLRKNNDYGEAWRQMAQESLVDLILTKLLRIRQILANDGHTQVSEGIDANLNDIVNYALFALIKIEETAVV